MSTPRRARERLTGDPPDDELARCLLNIKHEFLKQAEAGVLSHSDLQRLLHFLDQDRGRRWAKQRKCMYVDCREASIRKSHTVPRAASLSAIARGNHVVTPSLLLYDSSSPGQLRGLREASTFPGFCESHEAAFGSFERRGLPATHDEISLQVFRTICREIYVKQFTIAQLQRWQGLHESMQRTRGKSMLEKMVRTSFQTDDEEFIGKVSRMMESGLFRGVRTGVDDYIAELKRNLNVLKRQFYPESMQPVASALSHLHINSFTLDYQVPVCLAGQAAIMIGSQGRWERFVPVILCVLPSESGTTVIAAVARREQVALDRYVRSFRERPVGSLTLIETWMTHGTEHWFLSPEVWDSLSDERQRRIQATAASFERNISEEFPLSIFDKLRTEQLIQAIPDPDWVAWIAANPEWEVRERGKLADLLREAGGSGNPKPA